MQRLVVAILVLLAGTVRARADDDVDDHPLAQDLRAAFGRDISRCHGDKCELELHRVTCTSRGAATTCRAAGTRTARGPHAVQLAAHLREIGGTPATATRVALARISCVSTAVPTQPVRHGRCAVERTDGDGALDSDLDRLLTDDGSGPLVELCKLGEFCWTGTFHVACKRDACTFTCPPSTIGKDWLDACHLPDAAPVTQTNAPLAADLRARTGRSAATLSCSSSGGSIDGGLTSLVTCDAR
ncbi:MAG TPA: hypothetical protein VGM88_33385 [Kofleriaceae bacterium]|jgi:hypothetical protein